MAHDIGKLKKPCFPADQVDPRNGDLFLHLDVAQDRKEKILESNKDNPSQSAAASSLDDSGVAIPETSNQANCKYCGCTASPDTDAMDTSGDPVQESKYEWEQKRVTDSDIALMRKWQPNKLPVHEIESNAKINTWFEYIPIKANDGSYKESRYRCYYCHKYGPQFLFHKRYLSDLQKTEGIFLPISASNKNKIMGHANSRSHIHIINELKRKQDYTMENDIAGIIADKFEYCVTNRHMRLVYSAIKMYNSYESHRQMVFLQEKHKVFMGNRCGNAKTAKKMTLSIR